MMALSGSLGVMMAAWILNGLFCSLIWAPLVRLLTIVIPGEMLNKAMLNMQYCTAFGNVLTFLLVALITALMPWRATFFIIAALVLLAGVVWTWTLRRCEPHRGAAPRSGPHDASCKPGYGEGSVRQIRLYIYSAADALHGLPQGRDPDLGAQSHYRYIRHDAGSVGIPDRGAAADQHHRRVRRQAHAALEEGRRPALHRHSIRRRRGDSGAGRGSAGRSPPY